MASQVVGRSHPLAGIRGEMVGEFFGTMVLILFGDGCVASLVFFTNFVSLNWMVIAWDGASPLRSASMSREH